MNIINPFRRALHAADTTSDPTQETMLCEAMQSAYAVEEAPHDLRGRVADMALLHAQQQVMHLARPAFRLQRGLQRLASCVACAAFIAVVMAWPHIRTAYMLYRMQKAILSAKSINALTRYTRNGAATEWKYADDKNNAGTWIWIANGKWHIEASGCGYVYFDGSHLHRSDPANPKASAEECRALDMQIVTLDTNTPTYQYQWLGGGAFTQSPDLLYKYQQARGISLTQSPGRAALYGCFTTLVSLQSLMYIHGKVYRKYGWKRAYEDAPHTFLWVDAESNAPVKIDVERQYKGAWRPYSSTLIEYNVPLPSFP